jgi:competence protein ComEA
LFVLVIAVAASVTLLVIQSRNFSVIEAAGTRIEGITSSASSGEKDSSRSSDASETSSAQEKQKSDIQQKDEAGGAASEKTAEKSPSAENKPTAQTSPQDVRIDINSADATLLDTVKGIGPATAQKIIDYRTQNGRFASVDALVAVPGIGAKTLESMRSQLVAR